MPIYGDQQSQLTMNRAAYGDVPAAMITGASTTYGGASQGIQNMMSDVGQVVMPAMYTPPARMVVGSQGMIQQHTGLMRGLFGMVGIGPNTPSGTTHLEYGTNAAADVGERAASGMAAVAGLGVGLGVGVTAGRAVGTGVGAAVGSLFGPIGTGVGAAVGGFVGGAAATIATEHGISSAINQRREVQNFLGSSSFRFVGAGSDMADPIRGAGMSRGARSEAAEFIRSQDIADPMFDTSELTNILKQGTQLGMFAGSGDMDEFKNKFKDIVKNVKTVTRVLHQTLEEGMKTIKDLKTIGIDPSQVGSVVQQADALGKVAGRTGAEMISAGLQGAEIFRGTGVDMSIGFQSNQMNLASIRASRDAGALAQEAIAQAGGEEALAQRMTASGMAFSQSAFGRGANAQFFQGGGFNQQAFMRNMAGGGGDFIQNAQTAANNLSNPAALISYQANQEKFLSEMGKSMGGQGLLMNQLASSASYAEYISSSTGADKEDAFRLALKQQGMSHPEIETHLARMKSSQEGFAAGQAGAAATRDKMMVEQAQENFIMNRAGAKIGDYVKQVTDTVAAPLNRVIDASAEKAVTFYEEQVLGLQRADVRGIGTAGLSEKDIANFRDRKKGVVNLDAGGMLSKTSGEDLLSALESGNLDTLGVEVRTLRPGQRAADDDVVINDRGLSRGIRQVVSRGDIEQVDKLRRAHAVTTAQAEEAAKSGELDDVDSGFNAALTMGALDDVETGADLLMASFGKGIRGVSRKQIMKLRTQVKGTKFERMLDDISADLGKVGAAKDGLDTADLKVLQEDFEGRTDKLGDLLKVGDIPKELATELAVAIGKKPGKERQAAIEEISDDLLRAGVEPNKISQMNTIIKKDTGVVGEAAKELRATAAGIKIKQRDRGLDIISNIIGMRAEAADSTIDTKAESERVESIQDTIMSGGVKDLGKDDRAFLRENNLATDILGRMDKIESIDELAKSGKRGAVRDILKGTGLRHKNLESAVEQAMTGDRQALIKGLTSEAVESFATKTSASAAGGADVGGEGQGTAQQVFIQQSSVNTQVLAVLQGLAARLGVQ